MEESADSAGPGYHWPGRIVTVALAAALVVLVGLASFGFISASRSTKTPRSALDKELDDERAGVSTGTESTWDVKVGTDAQARVINLTPVATTVGWLTSQQRSSPNHRVAPIEFTVYTVTATLTDLRQEHDLDQKMTLEDDNGNRMLVELPDVSLSKTSVFAAQIKHAHEELAAWHGDLPTKVQVTGVGFFDEPTGQGDQARNEIELHPVLDLNFDPN